MRRGGRGGPQLLGNSVFWAAAVLFLAAAMVGGGCFSIFRRADDVTRTMSKGGGVLVNVQEWGCFSIFRRANDVTQTMSKEGGGGACEIPSFRKSCIRACYLCKILGNQPLRPPNQSVPIRLWSSACMHVCIYIYVCMFIL